MKILAFDSSSTACSVALMNNDEVKVLHKIAPMKHAQLILPMILELLDSFSITLKDLDAIAYGCGPGSFTGIRIASSVAQGLGFAANLPIIRVSSLAAIAQAAFLEHQWQNVLVSIDARMGQIYWGAYSVNTDGLMELVEQEVLITPEKVALPVACKLPKTLWYGVGDGFGVYQEKLITSLGVHLQKINASQLPSAESLVKLAKIKFASEDWIAPSEAIPVYLR